MQLDAQSIIAAVGEVLAEERKHRVELAARVDELTSQLRMPGPVGRDGRDGLNGLPGSVGERGEKGEPGEHGPEGPQGARGEPGEKGATGEPAYPGRACGLWNESESYRAMDVAVHNGSEWRAVSDNPGPLPGPGWVLGAKGVKGKPGDRGEKGERGERGERGPAGLSVTRADMIGFELVLTLSDDTRLVCNMLSVFERYHREAVA
jgi:Collagen triple helix repeat (20 copies)